MDREWYELVKDKDVEEQFTELFKRKVGEQKPGHSLWRSGRYLQNCDILRERLPDVCKLLDVKTFLDVGCGDYIWMKLVDLPDVYYKGVDVVRPLIDRNKEEYPGVNFEHFDITKDVPEKYDMIFMRSVFIHMTLENCHNIIENVKKSGSKYFMTSTTLESKTNLECKCLMLKKRNLFEEPFNFPEPVLIFKETSVDIADNYMGVWKVDEL